MKQIFELSVKFPIEKIEEWIKTQGVEEGHLFEHQEVVLNNVLYDESTGYIQFIGVVESRIDS